MYRSSLSEYCTQCRISRVPMSREGQHELLQACRFALWHKHDSELQSLFMACGMCEVEIIERKEFYLQYALMIGHMIILLPGLANHFLLEYIAEDMIDGDEPELKIAGQKLQTIIDNGKKHPEKVTGRVLMPPLPSLSDSRLAYYKNNQAAFISDFLEANWEYDSDRSLGLAVAAEILSLDPEDTDKIGNKLMNLIGKFSSREEFFYYFATTTARILYESNFSDWATLTLNVFAPLCGEFADELGQPTIPRARRDDLPQVPPELELAAISAVWKNKGVEEALLPAKERLKLTPGDAFACGMLGNIYLAKYDLPHAIACLSRAYWLAPDNCMVVFVLGQAFHAGYFEKQVDLCLEKLHAMPEYQQNPAAYQLGVELFIKCDEPETRATLNGKPVGRCPLQMRGIKPGHHTIVWQLPNGSKHTHQIKLDDATVAKFRYHPRSDSVSNEISRSGSITLFENGEAKLLSEVVSDFLVDDLTKLPNPTVEECTKGI